MSNGTKVKKRNGTIEPLNLEKMHVMVEQACEGLAGVSASQVEIQSGIQFYDGISTAEIQEILIKSASDLIDLDHPNYQYVAARLLLFSVKKSLYGRMHDTPDLREHVEKCVWNGIYDSEILKSYDEEEFDKLQDIIDHEKPIYIVEGPFDSTFLDNSIAMVGSDIDIRSYNWSNYIWVYDNEPRNREIINRISKTIDRGEKVVIWPNNIVQKDINDMVLSGHQVQDIVESNTFQGLQAKLNFTNWKKV